MNNLYRKGFITVACLLAFFQLNNAQIITSLPQKKLIDFGWNSPFTTELRNNFTKYENSPFDGLTIKLPKNVGGGNVFMVNELSKVSADTMEMERNLSANMLKSNILTDNFVAIYGGSQMDWFSDSDWSIVEKQVRYAAQMAKTMHCKGVLWDPEPYKPGKNPWCFQDQPGKGNRTYQQYYQQTRKRGAQFIKILQDEFPGLVVLSLREFSDFQQGSPFSEPMFPIVDENETLAKLSSAWWGLHLPFTLGILDAIDEKVKFIDCNEDAYYYTSALEFFQIRQVLKQDALVLVPAALRSKFASAYTLGCAVSSDYLTGNWANIISFPFRLSGQAKMLTPDEQALWFEHNIYYALRTCDEYAWLYTEHANWWTGENVPKGFAEALLRAKKKIADSKPLGFTVDDMLKSARDKAERFQPEVKK